MKDTRLWTSTTWRSTFKNTFKKSRCHPKVPGSGLSDSPAPLRAKSSPGGANPPWLLCNLSRDGEILLVRLTEGFYGFCVLGLFTDCDICRGLQGLLSLAFGCAVCTGCFMPPQFRLFTYCAGGWREGGYNEEWIRQVWVVQTR